MIFISQFSSAADVLYDMYTSNNRSIFARNKLRPFIESEVCKRKVIQLPSDRNVVEATYLIVKERVDSASPV
jgi:hypothetical protein